MDYEIANQNQPDMGEMCPKDDGFVYVGPSPNVWAGYLKDQLRHTLSPLPQERPGGIAERRAQGWKRTGWRSRAEAAAHDSVCWENSEEIARLGELIQAIRADGEELVEAGLAPGERTLFRAAVEMASGKRIQQRGVGIRDLSFLEGLNQLKELDLWDNDIEDLSPLASLTGLRKLWLPYNLISDLTPLAGLDRLVELMVYGNQITSLEPLRGLTSLNALNLRGNPLEPGALACLRKCKRLGMLNLSNTGLEDISGLEFCRAWMLNLYQNPNLTGLEVISTMKRLTCLYLDTETAYQYDIPALAPQLTEHAELNGLSVYTWPEKYYN